VAKDGTANQDRTISLKAAACSCLNKQTFDCQEEQEIVLYSTSSRHILSPIEYRFFPDVKRPERGDNTSAPSAKFSNEQSYAFMPCTTTA